MVCFSLRTVTFLQVGCYKGSLESSLLCPSAWHMTDILYLFNICILLNECSIGNGKIGEALSL